MPEREPIEIKYTTEHGQRRKIKYTPKPDGWLRSVYRHTGCAWAVEGRERVDDVGVSKPGIASRG